MGVVDEVKDRIDIVEFVSSYVPLQKTGRNYKGLCPFHADTTPSFVVFPDSQGWHCFGACGTGGDIFTFLMKKENLDFSEALRVLAQRAGIPLAPRSEEERAEDERQKLLRQINADAGRYFHHLLLHSPQGQAARDYLAGREVTDETWKTFQLGYGLPEWEALSRHLSDKGYEQEDIFAAGLTVERESGGYYDRFRGRLVFPICDYRGGVVGFGARALDDSVPKYVNTPQTRLFDKGSILYGIHLAKGPIRDQGAAIIVEGYMDVLMGHQNGFQNVVASMGTALTESQVSALRKLTKSFTLAMDADAAGRQASLRGLEVVKKQYGIEHRQSPEAREIYRHIRLKKYVDANIKIVTMPSGQDPDDVIRRDPEAWGQLVEGALPLMDYYFEVAAAGKSIDSAEEKSALVRELLPLIGEIRDGIERAHYLQKLGRLVRIDERTLAAEMVRLKPRGGVAAPVAGDEPSAIGQPLRGLEDYCLLLVLRSPNLIREIEDLSPDDFLSVEDRAIFEGLLDYLGGQESFDLGEFEAALDPLLAEHVEALLEGEDERPSLDEEELPGEVRRCVGRLKDRNDRRGLRELESLLRDAQERGDGAEELALRERVDSLGRKIKERQRMDSRRRTWRRTRAR